MKNLSILVLLVFSGLCQAMDAKQLKATALKACETQSANMPANMREQAKKLCVCNAEKTDYEAVLKAQASGDTKQIQANAMKVAQACTAQMK
ncbi:hypothetical protein [Pseudoteredinibacter isoporae]|uniref:Uncharacterized protein n=1 Tax=Pseudoteredinibacter isoporae TaxID=570281 RepID=A0A7X0MWT0_9GAMM|nr:hypothetical protein [Pseudoteredinibacter isoporae]MBB6521284.1 hypothetical protein [Pseudoteredinibacter isoporae]NHO86842.1 hypothetical protein [Pseudoteredinibacter isoporae]NIB24706.1 hypothetical protein [Pseudoteredinibacter isoporae]